jgi:hypothetical protein
MKGVTVISAIVVATMGVTVFAVQVTAASSSQPLPVTYGFDGGSGWQHSQVRPHEIYFGAGGSLLVRGLTWLSWTENSAVGSGVRWADNCRPTCATGTYAKVQAEMTLSRLRSHDGSSYFSRMTMQWFSRGKPHKAIFRWSRNLVHRAPPFWSEYVRPGHNSDRS